MKLVLQRVKEASVSVDGETIGAIGRGLVVFLGVGRNDTEKDADRYLEKMMKLRIFEDADGKTNLALGDVHGELLIISQFTLYANCRKGNRPSFIEAGEPDRAEALYEYVVRRAKQMTDVVEQGRFGADMQVSLINDGPFTILMDEDLFR